MVKLKYSKNAGVSSQMGLLRFSEENAKGLKLNPKVFLVAAFVLVVLLYLFHLFLKF